MVYHTCRQCNNTHSQSCHSFYCEERNKCEIVRDNNQSYFCISDNFTEIFPFGNSFLQSNGYKPTPLDLSTVQMSEVLEDLVDMLAENTHNVWAKDRIKNGWTYGLFEVCN